MDVPAPLILLVDNDPHVLEMLARLVEIVTHVAEIVTADSASAALAVLASRTVALVMTDYQMPEMNGLELARAIKATSPATCVAIMSGEDPLDIERRVRGVAEYVLPKPFMLKELRAIMTDCLPSGGGKEL